MSDRSLRPTPFLPSSHLTLSSGFGLYAYFGYTYTLSINNLTYAYRGAANGPDNPPYVGYTPQYLTYTIIPPMPLGTMTLDGVPTTTFTQQQVYDGRVVFHPDGVTWGTGTLNLFASFTDVAGVVNPYTPHDTSYFTTPGYSSGSFGFGALLRGGATPPAAVLVGGNFAPFIDTNHATSPVATTGPNQLIIALTYNLRSSTTAYPAPVFVSSMTAPGLEFTRVGGAAFNAENNDSGVHHYVTTTTEIWTAPAPSVVSSTIAATCPPLGTGPNSISGVLWAAYSGVADLANPWGTDVGASQIFATNALPISFSMTTSAPDYQLLPVLFRTMNGYSGLVGSWVTGPGPKGYGEVTGMGGGSGGTGSIVGFQYADAWGRYDVATISMSVTVYPPRIVDDSELFFDPVNAFVDFNNPGNRSKFVSDDGTPQWVGSHGELPFRTPAAVYLNTMGPPTDFTNNNGTAGAFPASGTINPSGTAPGCSFPVVDEIANSITSDGWRLSVSDDGAQTWNRLVKPRQIGAEGDYLRRLRWLKMGQSRERVLKLECTDPVRRNIIGVYIDGAEGMG